jgi:NAD+ synthase (glutamine-hydrolysing)
MKLIKVAAAAVNQTPLDWKNNTRHIMRAIESARDAGVTVLCLPEQCIPGYGCEDAFHAPMVRKRSMDILLDVAALTRGMIVSLGLPVLYRNGLFNVAVLLVDGEIAGFVPKRFLAGDGLHYEPRWFKPWPADERDTVRVGDRDIPIGDIYFDCGGIKIGFEVCEDAWVAERPGARLARKGVDIILNPSASHFAFQKLDVRKRFVLEGSRAFAVTYLYSNLLGNDSGRVIYDGGALIASGGTMLATGPRFGYSDMVLTTAVADIERTRMVQARTGSFRPCFDEEPGECVSVDFTFPDLESPTVQEPQDAGWEQAPHHKEEEFTRAVCLGLFDYMRKCRAQGFTVSLSGGADSSACTALVWLMVQLAGAELGMEGLKARLGHVDSSAQWSSHDDAVREILLCVYQATRNSSQRTFDAARELAEGVGARFMRFDVDDLVEGYVAMVSKAIGRPITWQDDDLAMQNIQARVRAPGVWMLANIHRFLLLATSNRSEAAVGYATMDGDTCGGLSPIAGIDKAFLRQWLKWLEIQGPTGGEALSILHLVNSQVPTAELRPQEEEQTDEKDLMPYPLLDAIEKAAIRDKRAPVDVYRLMKGQFPAYGSAQLGNWVKRFFTLWCRNQWKRERYAPSFHVDDENLDPKTWCRFPILSGGFEMELAELDDVLAKE